MCVWGNSENSFFHLSERKKVEQSALGVAGEGRTTEMFLCR
jgi:hypothetical protein